MEGVLWWKKTTETEQKGESLSGKDHFPGIEQSIWNVGEVVTAVKNPLSTSFLLSTILLLTPSQGCVVIFVISCLSFLVILGVDERKSSGVSTWTLSGHPTILSLTFSHSHVHELADAFVRLLEHSRDRYLNLPRIRATPAQGRRRRACPFPFLAAPGVQHGWGR